MTWTNYDDVLAQLRACGLVVDRLDVDSHKITRCKVEGDHEKRGWYRLFSLGDLIAGAYGIWSANDPQSFKVELPKAERKVLTADQIAAIKAKQETEKKRAEAERAREIERAALQASVWWRKLQDAGASGYMAKKGFDATELFGARVSPSGNLVVPVQDTTGKTFGLQVIMAKKNRHGRDKDFTPPGLAKKGHFFQLGLVQRGGTVLLCEGFATGASLRKATGLPVVVAFDAGNLTPVAMAIHKAHRKDVRILVCADDDYLTDAKTGKNPGRDAAQTAALAVEGAVVWPAFPGERSTTEKGPTDFNDLHVHPDGGLQAVRAQVEAALATAGWPSPKRHARAESVPQGAGETAGGHAKVSVPSGQRAQAVMYLDDIVERFIPLDDGTGDYVWDTWTRKIVKHKQMITLLKAGVRGDDIKRHPVWEERGAYYLHEVGFDPTEQDATVKLNTWQGWPLEPKAGKCEIIRQLLQYLCIEDHIYRWLLCWMAWPLQHPGAKLGSAVIMHGPQGTGKSVVFNVILATVYGRYATVLNQRGIEDRFNSDYTDSKLYVCTEEAFASEKWHVRHELKELVTGATVRINPKNVAAYSQKNQMNFVFLSNEGQPLPLENDDRRHLVVYTPPKLNPDFYDEVFTEIDNGGTEAFYHYLLNLDIERTYPGWHPKKHPPMTEAKQALIDLSAPSESRFVKDWLHGDADLPICPALATDAYEAYMRWCRRNGEARPRPSNHFIGYLDRLGGWTKKKVQTYSNSDYHGEPKVQSVIFPPKAALQAAGYDQPDGHTQLRWVTDSTCRFHDSVHGEEKWRATG
jgi:putative DNA primase/helicase